MSQATVTITSISARISGSVGVEEQGLPAGKGDSVAVPVWEDEGSHAKREPSGARGKDEGCAHPTLAWLAASWHHTHMTFLRVRHVFPRWTYFPIMFFT